MMCMVCGKHVVYPYVCRLCGRTICISCVEEGQVCKECVKSGKKYK
ncbi:MAG TPA: hypothetical protein PLO36_01075 [Methanofastidiosum sp.]|nr:hypothetical protein [Methanofastidiosum sp.]HQQ48054.1 hypothetical protein [Methanofastidiosum sp.]